MYATLTKAFSLSITSFRLFNTSFLGQYDIPKHEAINWKQVTENANNMGMQRHKMIKMPVDTHLAGRSFRGSVCKCSHYKDIFLWNLVLLCPHTSPDPKLVVDMGVTSMQKRLRKLQGARLYGSRGARLNFLSCQVGSPGEVKCIFFHAKIIG